MADLEAWELDGRLRNYLVAMAERIERIADDDERSAAIKWLEWCEHYTTERDPLNKPIRTPTVSARLQRHCAISKAPRVWCGLLVMAA